MFNYLRNNYTSTCCLSCQFTSEEFVPRTKAVHERHCSSLNGSAHASVTTTYGVTHNSVLNDLEHSMSHQDLLQISCTTFEFQSMLSVFIQDLKLFPLATFNRRIQYFPDAKNKPLPLPTHILSASPNNALKQSCKQYLSHHFFRLPSTS